jgi:DNA-3-methyladenine glycosylase
MTRLPRSFFDRDTLGVARDLLGQRLVRVLDGERLSGLICETEAYGGPDDEASHAYRRTSRSAIMYGPPGFAYVYFIYGVHFCLNAVTEADGRPGAVLLRAIVPGEGIASMQTRRGGFRGAQGLADGPGKLCRAFGITREQNGLDLVTSDQLFIEAGAAAPEAQVEVTPRIGVRGDAAVRGRLWRFMWRIHAILAPDDPSHRLHLGHAQGQSCGQVDRGPDDQADRAEEE